MSITSCTYKHSVVLSFHDESILDGGTIVRLECYSIVVDDKTKWSITDAIKVGGTYYCLGHLLGTVPDKVITITTNNIGSSTMTIHDDFVSCSYDDFIRVVLSMSKLVDTSLLTYKSFSYTK